jgi:hypothetical protein
MPGFTDFCRCVECCGMCFVLVSRRHIVILGAMPVQYLTIIFVSVILLLL